jgi:hypothetical protein
MRDVWEAEEYRERCDLRGYVSQVRCHDPAVSSSVGDCVRLFGDMFHVWASGILLSAGYTGSNPRGLTRNSMDFAWTEGISWGYLTVMLILAIAATALVQSDILR